MTKLDIIGSECNVTLFITYLCVVPASHVLVFRKHEDDFHLGVFVFSGIFSLVCTFFKRCALPF